MGRTAAYTVKVHDGREIGFGLVVRSGDVYSVQFRDTDGGKFIFRSTGKTSRPQAIAKAEEIIKEHYAPAGALNRHSTWDETVAELRKHLEKDALRDATVKDYLDTLNQVKDAAVCPGAVSAGLAQQWCNRYLTTPYTRAKPKKEEKASDAPASAKPRRGRKKKTKEKDEPKSYTRSPATLHARVRKLSAIWSKYLVKRLRIADANPWETVDLPKLEAGPVRTLAAEQVNDFFDWLAARWKGWELPSLFFEVKAVTGCRLGDLAALKSFDLGTVKNGQEVQHVITFHPTTTKGRKGRVAVLPEDLWEKLRTIAGRVWLWESYTTEIVKYLELRGVPTHRVNPEFDPERLVWWAKDEVDDFNKSRLDMPKIQSHDFRKRVVTEGHRAGLDVDTVAAGVGMSVQTARRYYLAIEQDKAAAAVAAKIGGALRPKKVEPKPDA